VRRKIARTPLRSDVVVFDRDQDDGGVLWQSMLASCAQLNRNAWDPITKSLLGSIDSGERAPTATQKKLADSRRRRRSIKPIRKKRSLPNIDHFIEHSHTINLANFPRGDETFHPDEALAELEKALEINSFAAGIASTQADNESQIDSRKRRSTNATLPSGCTAAPTGRESDDDMAGQTEGFRDDDLARIGDYALRCHHAGLTAVPNHIPIAAVAL
jgi:hypothetical protein